MDGILSVFLSEYSHAGTWIDEFDGNELNGWERVAEDNPWFAKWILIDDPGFLYGGIVKPKQEGVTAADFLHWNAHQFRLNRFVVVGEEIYCEWFARDAKGELCLFLGKRKPAPDFAEGYIFCPCFTEKMEFSEKGVYKDGEIKASYIDSLKFTIVSLFLSNEVIFSLFALGCLQVGIIYH